MRSLATVALLATAAVVTACGGGDTTTNNGSMTAGTFSVQGVVSDSRTALPLPGATVKVYSGNAASAKTATTDDDGYYSVAGVTQGANVVVLASRSGYQSRAVNLIITATDGTLIIPDVLTGNVALTPSSLPVTVQGVITDAQDFIPIAGASVTIYYGDANGNTRTATTDANGYYVVANVPVQASIIIEVSKSGYMTRAITYNSPGGGSPYANPVVDGSMALYGDSVHGVITDSVAAQPIAGAVVSFYLGDGQAPLTATTDANGYYSITNVPMYQYIIVQVTATGYYSRSTSTYGSYGMRDVSLALTPAGGPYTVFGLVTDFITGFPLEGVTVTLYSDVSQPVAVTSSAQGFFTVKNVPFSLNTFLGYTKTGFAPVTQLVRLDDGTGLKPLYNSVVQVGAVSMKHATTIDIGGTVWAGSVPANGADVYLYSSSVYSGHGALLGYYAYVAQTKADANGRFTFPAQLAGWSYQVVVWPYDLDNNGRAEFGTKFVNITDGSTTNWSNLVVNLSPVADVIAAGSFVSLSSNYPLAATNAGTVSGTLPRTQTAIKLVFGAQVIDNLTSFELRQRDFAGGDGTILAATVAWDAARSIVTITPAAALVSDPGRHINYELRITSLVYADGTVAVDDSLHQPYVITFDVKALPSLLASPTPAFYVADLVSGQGKPATAATVNANWIDVTDASGNVATVWNDTTGFDLSWDAVPGAADYYVYARNKPTSLAAVVTGQYEWTKVGATLSAGVDTGGNTRVFASGVMSGDFATFGLHGDTFGFGTEVDVAVSTVDVNGYESAIDATKQLALADTLTAKLTTAGLLDTSGPNGFAQTNEWSPSVLKTLQFTFNEKIRAGTAPLLHPLSGYLSMAAPQTAGFDAVSGNTDQQYSTSLWIKAPLLLNGGTCVGAVSGLATYTDLVVEETSFFATTALNEILVWGPGVIWPPQSYSVTAISTATGKGVLTVTPALSTDVPAHTWVCAVKSGAAANATRLTTLTTHVLNGGAIYDVTLPTLAPFYWGQSVLVYSSPTVTGFGTITGLTTTGTGPFSAQITYSVLVGAPAAGAIVVPLAAGALSEYALRGATPLTPSSVETPAGTAVDVRVTSAPASVAVGDSVLLDKDGDLTTLDDQALVTIRGISTPTGQFHVIIDVPANVAPLVSGTSVLMALGDAFTLDNVVDTSGNAGLRAHSSVMCNNGGIEIH